MFLFTRSVRIMSHPESEKTLSRMNKRKKKYLSNEINFDYDKKNEDEIKLNKKVINNC